MLRPRLVIPLVTLASLAAVAAAQRPAHAQVQCSALDGNYDGWISVDNGKHTPLVVTGDTCDFSIFDHDQVVATGFGGDQVVNMYVPFETGRAICQGSYDAGAHVLSTHCEEATDAETPRVFDLKLTRTAGPAGPPKLSLDSAHTRMCTDGDTLCIEGTFSADGTHVTGNAAVWTHAMRMELDDADLTVDLSKPAVSGTATISFPTFGVLSGLQSGTAQAAVYIGYGTDTTFHLEDADFHPRTDRFYVHTQLQGQLDVAIAATGQKLFEMKPGATTLLELQSPILYMDKVAGSPLGDMIDVPGVQSFAFSLDPRLCFNFTTQHPMLDLYTGQLATRSTCANLRVRGSGSIEVIDFSGELAVDLDADGDGKTIFEGQSRDFTLGGNLDIGIGIGDTQLSVTVGSSAMFYEASVGSSGRISVASVGGSAAMFGKTPLKDFMGGLSPHTWATASGGDARVRWTVDYSVVAGFNVANATTNVRVHDRDITVELSGKVGLPGTPLGVDVTGSIDLATKQFALTGTGNLGFGDAVIANAAVTLSNAGVAFGGAIGLDLPGIAISGQVASRKDGNEGTQPEIVTPTNFGMFGNVAINIYGHELASGTVQASTGKRIKLGFFQISGDGMIVIRGKMGYGPVRVDLMGVAGRRLFFASGSVKVNGSSSVSFPGKSISVSASGTASLSVGTQVGIKFHFDGNVKPVGHQSVDISSDGKIRVSVGWKFFSTTVTIPLY
ncbi:MAG: hypothetical protein KC464_31750 [Myxococcales bacterium]|nr:hypothetical protein [Myxococcales bacterium]